ncbi:hypothetical protein AAC387_Pa11g2191 [Persea americana]
MNRLAAAQDAFVIGETCNWKRFYLTPAEVSNGWDGGTKAKSKSGKGPESGVDSAHATGDQSATPTSMAPSQNLTPSAVSGWLVSRTMDVSSDEMDIDLTRGLHFSHSVKAFGSNVYNLNLTLMWKRTRMCITAIK